MAKQNVPGGPAIASSDRGAQKRRREGSLPRGAISAEALGPSDHLLTALDDRVLDFDVRPCVVD
jgi:hypothetical protein